MNSALLHTTARLLTLVALLTGMGLILPACHNPLREERQIIQGQTYPDQAEVGQPLDIVVERVDRDHVRFHNRTPRSYKDVRVWLNHRYGATLEELPIGTSAPVALERFSDRYGTLYPTGSFLAPDKSEVVVMADLVEEGTLHKLTVDLPRNWQIQRGEVRGY